MCSEAIKNNKKGTIYTKMVKNIMDNIDIGEIYRLDVNFEI